MPSNTTLCIIYRENYRLLSSYALRSKIAKSLQIQLSINQSINQKHYILCALKLADRLSLGTRQGLGPKISLSPPRDIGPNGQRSGGKLLEIFKFWSFKQSNSVYNVYKLFQPADLIPGLCPWTPLGDHLSYCPHMNSWRRHMAMSPNFWRSTFSPFFTARRMLARH